ncbi:DUF6455 family protein [Oceanicola sp. S124]|uniref:DUF6455 family protein n=1 Tax=Oceanicola sp. S124 TaxID=1042378 RepID=UPI000255A9D0|nr:DUF6455 family protein [Oceanicola sp. S124]
MTPKGDQVTHYWLVQRMAKSLGCDPAGAMALGRLDAEGWATMVERCRGCDKTDACCRWLRSGELEELPRDRAMPGCRNAMIFAGL